MVITNFHAKYYANELIRKAPSDSIDKFTSTLAASKVDLNPHQIDAALFAFKSPFSKGAILADEVGLGKTIEAGIVLAQKWAENKTKIIIIAPSSLRKQWLEELANKFFLDAVIMDTESFKDNLEKGKSNPFDQNKIVICSYNFAKIKEDNIKKINWDLAVIDEAHRMRNIYRNTNKIAKSISTALGECPKILLTATPLQNSLLELYGLVSIIDPHVFGDISSFRSQFIKVTEDDKINYGDLRERLATICKRTLRKEVLEYIKYTSRYAIVQEFKPSKEEQELYDLVSAYLQRPKLYALHPSQRHLMTLVMRRLLASSSFAIQGTLKAFINKLYLTINDGKIRDVKELIGEEVENFEELDDDVSERKKDDDSEEETESYDEKYGNKRNAEKDKNGKNKDEKISANEKNQSEKTVKELKEELKYRTHPISAVEKEEIKMEIAELKLFIDLAETIQKNAKGEQVTTALNKGFAKLKAIGAPEKALIFTEFKRTQRYLFDLLSKTEFKGKIVMFNGTNDDPESIAIYEKWLEKYKGTDKITGSKSSDIRAALVDHFKNSAQILIATEAASEGINLQFCSLVMNYDLPWNPQKIEQRIGRCHRYGQNFDVVVINFVNKANDADKRVYELLDKKLKLFNGVFGASDEILGILGDGIDIEGRINQIYQGCRTSEEIKTSFDNLQKELDEQIANEMKKTRRKLLENFDLDVQDKLKLCLKESKNNLSTFENMLFEITQFALEDNATFNEKETSFELLKNPYKDIDVPLGKYKIGGKGGDKFNSYMLGHPLAQKIIAECFKNRGDMSEIEFYLDSNDTANNTVIIDNKIIDDKTTPAVANSEIPQSTKTEPITNSSTTSTPNTKSKRSKKSILESFQGKSGDLEFWKMRIRALSDEEHLFFIGFADDGTVLDDIDAKQLFNLSGKVIKSNIKVKSEYKLKAHFEEKRVKVEKTITEKNARYFDEEVGKLDMWSEDKRQNLRRILNELDDKILLLKKEAKLCQDLAEKVNKQKEIRALEDKRESEWKNYDKEYKNISIQKDLLLEGLEARLTQKVNCERIFSIRWKLI